ncbi:MAG: hypothetical protein JST80_04410 [Bdellovibrionales bacterium]|nr:hypothetical protein [Bdellovibrionales bacterium]
MKTTTTTAILGLMIMSPLAHASKTVDAAKKMETLLGHPAAVLNVFDAQKQNLDSGAAKFQPWSGSYWPDINGGITNHYRDHGKFGAQIKFVLRYDAAKGRFRRDHADVCTNYDVWDATELNKKLSPAEKYDLLIGNTDFKFTKNIMDEMDFRADYRITTKKADGTESDSDASQGDDNNFFEDAVDSRTGENATYAKFDNAVEYRYWRKKGGSLAYWSGICDGWSPASIYLPRPEKPVTVKGALGHMITFYPDDLKALGSYLFARTNTPYQATMNYQFAGRKCNESGEPATAENGLVKDIRCNDLDAGIWHLALLNRIGKDKMGFVFDVDNNLKINNHPVSSYQISYFNPVTGSVGSLKDSVVARSTLKQDGYAKFRNAKGKYLVGVKSKIKFLYYVWPEQNRDKDYDDVSKDKTKSKEYAYDLELDEKGNILGGEWGDRSEDGIDDSEDADSDNPVFKVKYADQPDFIWMAPLNKLPTSEMSDYAIAGVKKDLTSARPFGNMEWAWDGKGKLPEDWINAAKADETWQRPVSVDAKDELDSTPAAKNSVLKSAQPLSHIVYYLFDKARNPAQK